MESFHFRRFKSFWRRFKQNRVAVLGLGLIISLTALALLAPYISPSDPFKMNLNKRMLPPSFTNLMGTDQFGRDVSSRVIWGTRVSLFVGLVAAGISALVGVVVGAISGYYGGKIDEVLMRIVEVFLTIPTFFLILLILAVFGRNIWLTMAIIGLTYWPGTARLIRAECLSFKEQEFVEAARGVGASDFHIIFREILPNAIFPAVVNTSLLVAQAILIEAALSFLGIGDPNLVSWGWILNDALKVFRSAWWTALFPGVMISITVMAFNLVGDGLNDALNPRLKER